MLTFNSKYVSVLYVSISGNGNAETGVAGNGAQVIKTLQRGSGST